MAVSTKTAAKAKVATAVAEAQKSAEPEMVSIELTKITRLHVFGTLFEKGRVYTLAAKDAERLLAIEYSEVPAFKRFRGKVETKGNEAPVVVAQAVALAQEIELAPEAPKGIEIASEEELAELGLDSIDEEGVEVL